MCSDGRGEGEGGTMMQKGNRKVVKRMEGHKGAEEVTAQLLGCRTCSSYPLGRLSHVGFVLDTSGNIVTNWHVLQTVLKGLGANPNGKRVARVTLLRPDGVQQTFDGVLVRRGCGGVSRGSRLLPTDGWIAIVLRPSSQPSVHDDDCSLKNCSLQASASLKILLTGIHLWTIVKNILLPPLLFRLGPTRPGIWQWCASTFPRSCCGRCHWRRARGRACGWGSRSSPLGTRSDSTARSPQVRPSASNPAEPMA